MKSFACTLVVVLMTLINSAYGAGAVTKNELQRVVFSSPPGSTRVAEARSLFSTVTGRERSCVDVACSKVGCNFESDAAELARACAGNYDGACLQAGCSRASCNFKTDVIEIATSCRGNYGADCVKAACDSAGCNFKTDFVEFANACQGVDGECVRYLCQRSGCHFRSDVMNIINSCRGN